MREDDNDIPDWETLPDQEELIRKREWDVMLVFDACRFGAMEDVVDDDMHVDPVATPARNSTPDWTSTVWDGDWSDVTYYSANPFSEYVSEMDDYMFDLDEHVGEFIRAWNTEAHYDSLGVVPARGITNLVMDDNPNEPLVVHYLQPHPPFVGGAMMQFRSGENTFTDILPEFDGNGPRTRPSRFVYHGMMDEEILRALYLENLATAYRHAERLINIYDSSNIVLTADHGEALGREGWDHGGPEANVARTIPWVELYD